ncbi:hypothetical protein [Lysobacter enzymogenes]|uniref:hypothetical protein n=1 Tax=Lysobacter enzymogenes TaxID=69 RepID=UPI000F4B91A3|nr:hypothetical protein [Lysobacter enzymogenes]
MEICQKVLFSKSVSGGGAYETKQGKQPRFNPIVGELDDNGTIHVTCDKKHYGVVLYNSRRYEVLVKSAARAFLDGYTNEVVAVMSSALARAYEFYIRVSCRAKELSQESVDAAWKSVAAQSERQFGAFQFLYLQDNQAPFMLDPLVTEIRNKVIHRGKIVREAEALNFAEKVFSAIRHLDDTLQSKFAGHVKAEAEREIKFQEDNVPTGIEHVTLSATTVNVDTSKNEVIGTVTRFIEHVAAIHQSRERGFPD